VCVCVCVCVCVFAGEATGSSAIKEIGRCYPSNPLYVEEVAWGDFLGSSSLLFWPCWAAYWDFLAPGGQF
jgi:hypothetical protein